MAHDRVEAVERALKLLDVFSIHDNRLTLADLAEKTGFYKSTILRLSRSLERFGYLVREESGAYRPGPALWRLGSLYRHDFELGEHVRPALRRLRDDSNETASFYIRDGDVRVCLYRENSKRPIRHHLDEGVQLTLERGAAGKLLLAYTGARNSESDKVRKQGYVVSLGERDPEIAAVAVPVRRAGGKVIGTLAISGLITHFDKPFQKACATLLKEEAEKLERRLIDT